MHLLCVGLAIGTVCGGVVGFFLAAMCHAAAQADRAVEKIFDAEYRKED